jgi:RNA polymerase sigma factor (sigma-70 family)
VRASARPPRRGDLVGFETLYRGEFELVLRFFARRCGEAQTVADLTADTFLEALKSFRGAPPAPGRERAWTLAIARRVYARHCARSVRDRDLSARLITREPLGRDEAEEIGERIDAERRGRDLLVGIRGLPAHEREVLEAVAIDGESPRDAARTLGISWSALRVRLFRARARLRKEGGDSDEV